MSENLEDPKLIPTVVIQHGMYINGNNKTNININNDFNCSDIESDLFSESP